MKQQLTLRHNFGTSAVYLTQKSDGLRTSGKEAEQLYSSFEKWRTLARQIENDRQMMSDAQSNDALNNLIDRLDTEQQQIKRHLADRTLSLSQVLENHEHFTRRFTEIKIRNTTRLLKIGKMSLLSSKG